MHKTGNTHVSIWLVIFSVYSRMGRQEAANMSTTTTNMLTDRNRSMTDDCKPEETVLNATGEPSQSDVTDQHITADDTESEQNNEIIIITTEGSEQGNCNATVHEVCG